MGVHGLTTFLRENQAAIAQKLHFSTAAVEQDEATNFVIDGWSFIYELLALSNAPWVYGGDYGDFADEVTRVVKTWLALGLQLHFVFDGPYPAVKFPTISSRITKSSVDGLLLFFRTSPTSRMSPRFLNDRNILPPRMYVACIEALQQLRSSTFEPNHGQAQLSLELHFADEEGDPYAVELAGRLGGYVVAKDSDFVILNAEGYKGYIPMDEMMWANVDVADESDHSGEDGFHTVINNKSKKKAVALQKAGVEWGILPPDYDQDIEFSVYVYSPAAVASHLQIPISLLPLLAALVGNDFTGSKDPYAVSTSQQKNLQWLFFDRQLTLSQRITRVSTTIRSILHAAVTGAARGKPKLQVNSVMQLIERSVMTLLVRSPDTMGSGEKEKVVERIVEATLQYAISRHEGDPGLNGLWPSPLCALHDIEACPLVKCLSHSADIDSQSQDAFEEDPRQAQIRELYISAYRSGHIHPRLLDTMNTGTYWCKMFLESPDLESVSITFARPLHQICYALLDDGLGLPDRPDEPEDDEDQSKADVDSSDDKDDEDEDDDELVDVVEESDDEDPLAPLRGALQQLDGDESASDRATDATPSISSRTVRNSSKPKTIIEYVRRGTRLAAEEVAVPSVSQVLKHVGGFEDNGIPIQLWPEEERLTFFFRALADSDIPGVRHLPPQDVIIVLALRWVLSRLQKRMEESEGNKNRMKERWTKQEARAYLASYYAPSNPAMVDEFPSVSDRNAQLVSQALTAAEAIEQLQQVLLLSHNFPSPVLRFSGKTFHSYLIAPQSIPASAVSSAIWTACVDGMEGCFSVIVIRKKKERNGDTGDRVETPKAITPSTSKGRPRKAAAGGGMFGILSGMDS